MAKKTAWHNKQVVGARKKAEAISNAVVNGTKQADGTFIDLSPQTPSKETEQIFDGNAIVPTGLRVVKQELRYDQYGFPYVDVTFEWDAVDGVLQEYNLRVAEVNE